MSVKRVWVVLALVVAACGGGDDVGVQVDPPVAETAAGPQTTEGETTTQSTAAAAPTATTAAGMESSGGESIAMVTIGDRQYEFALEGRFTQCRLFAGAALFGSGYTVDGDGSLQSTNDAGASVTFHLPVADWEEKGLDEPSIKVSDNSDDTDWLAGEVDRLNIDPELSKIVSWTLDGATATGTALFVELNQAIGGTAESVPGTFEVSCATP